MKDFESKMVSYCFKSQLCQINKSIAIHDDVHSWIIHELKQFGKIVFIIMGKVSSQVINCKQESGGIGKGR